VFRPGRTESLVYARKKRRGTLVAALIDPDDFTAEDASNVSVKCESAGASMILVGGSTIADQEHLNAIVRGIKNHVTIPVILFPGNITGISRYADAIFFSSLLNSSNNYFIIGAQAIGAVQVLKYGLEAIPMGYLVFGAKSSTGFVGQVNPIPEDKPSIAIMYALAAQYMGMRTLYLEAGSGSMTSVPAEVVRKVREYFKGLLIVGGGITKPEIARELASAGADVIVIGNLLQSKAGLAKLSGIIRATRSL
jgi:phosphoglycerol geranylgeranyltransferase